MGYEVALHLYKREVGPWPEKVDHFCFQEENMVLFYKTVKKNELYSFIPSIQGTGQHTDLPGDCLVFKKLSAPS